MAKTSVSEFNFLLTITTNEKNSVENDEEKRLSVEGRRTNAHKTHRHTDRHDRKHYHAAFAVIKNECLGPKTNSK